MACNGLVVGLHLLVRQGAGKLRLKQFQRQQRALPVWPVVFLHLPRRSTQGMQHQQQSHGALLAVHNVVLWAGWHLTLAGWLCHRLHMHHHRAHAVAVSPLLLPCCQRLLLNIA